MNFLVKIWEWLDGNKLVIGTACIALAPFFQPHTFIHQALLYVGATFGGVGLGHKLLKGTKNTGK